MNSLSKPVLKHTTLLQELEKYVRYTYLLLLAFCIILPSGNIGPLPVKSVFYLLAFLSLFLYLFLRRRVATPTFRLLLALCLVTTFLLLWFGLAIIHPDNKWSIAASAFQSLLITTSLVFLSLLVFQEKLLNFKILLKTLAYSSFLYSLFKLSTILAIYVGMISFESLNSFYVDVFGTQFTSLLIAPGLIRIQLVNDIITPFLLFFVLQAKRFEVRFSRFFIGIFVSLSLLSIFFTYSRFVFLLTFSLAVLYIASHLLRKLNGIIATLLLIMLLLGFIGVFSDPILSLFQDRFTSEQVTESDAIRSSQWKALVDKIVLSPVLGHGIGAYAPDVIRDPEHPYSYELQWFALFLQFGALGMGCLLIYVGLVVSPAFSAHRPAFALVILTAYSLFLLSGFTNPYLISSASSVVFSLFALASRTSTGNINER